MGLGPAAVKLYLELWQRGFFKDIRSVAELGAQDLQLKSTELKALLDASGMKDVPEGAFDSLEHWPGQPRLSAKPLYELLGVSDYRSVDMNGVHGSIRHDLNLPLEDRSWYGKFDLVTDHGTAEHAFDIAECYRTMHRLCKPQGFLIATQAVYKGNGYYRFDPSFYEGLAAANGYQVLYSSYVVTLPDQEMVYQQFHVPLSERLLEAIDWAKVSSIEISYVLKKGAEADFKLPYQDAYLAIREKNHGYRLRFLPSPPSYGYVPVFSDDLKSVPARDILSALAGRFLGRLGR